MILRRLIYLLSLVACVLFFLGYRLWFAWYALVALLCLPLFSLLVSLPAMFTARLKMHLPHSVPMDTDQLMALRCTSAICPPPWKCKLEVARALTQEKWIVSENAPLPTEHCGALLCTIRKPKVYDYLGLFRRKLKCDPVHTVFVRPNPIPMHIPDLDRFAARAWRPKWGGGFSENHELRLYRPGDNVRQIHWKLSAKTGSPILRQPMEPIRERVLVRLDLCGSREELDRKLGRLAWLGSQLLNRDCPFVLQTLTGLGLSSRNITDPESFEQAMDALLGCAPVSTAPAPTAPASAGHQFYIGGGADEE